MSEPELVRLRAGDGGASGIERLEVVLELDRRDVEAVGGREAFAELVELAADGRSEPVEEAVLAAGGAGSGPLDV